MAGNAKTDDLVPAADAIILRNRELMAAASCPDDCRDRGWGAFGSSSHSDTAVLEAGDYCPVQQDRGHWSVRPS